MIACRKLATATSAALALVISAAPAAVAQSDAPLAIVSAVYGGENMARPADFTERLRQACGPDSRYCQAFCSEATIGEEALALRYRLGLHRVCRVVYRCGSETTRASEADRNDLITLDCRSKR